MVPLPEYILASNFTIANENMKKSTCELEILWYIGFAIGSKRAKDSKGPKESERPEPLESQEKNTERRCKSEKSDYVNGLVV